MNVDLFSQSVYGVFVRDVFYHESCSRVVVNILEINCQGIYVGICEIIVIVALTVHLRIVARIRFDGRSY